MTSPLDNRMPAFWSEPRDARTVRQWLTGPAALDEERKCFDCPRPGAYLAAPDGNWQVWRWHCSHHRAEAWGTVIAAYDFDALNPALLALAEPVLTPLQHLAIATVYAARQALERASSDECPRARRRLRLAMLRAERVGCSPWAGDELLAAMGDETEDETAELDGRARG